MNEENPKKVGPIATILVIVLILVIAALYLFASKINNEAVPAPDQNQTAIEEDVEDYTANASVSIPEITNTSENLQDIYDDLNNSTNGLEAQTF